MTEIDLKLMELGISLKALWFAPTKDFRKFKKIINKKPYEKKLNDWVLHPEFVKLWGLPNVEYEAWKTGFSLNKIIPPITIIEHFSPPTDAQKRIFTEVQKHINNGCRKNDAVNKVRLSEHWNDLTAIYQELKKYELRSATTGELIRLYFDNKYPAKSILTIKPNTNEELKIFLNHFASYKPLLR